MTAPTPAPLLWAGIPLPRRWPSEDRAREEVYARSHGVCEICGQRAASWAHRRSAGQGGAWTPWNGLHLCGDGTRGCHAWTERHADHADTAGWRLVHRDPDPQTVPAWLRGHGWVLIVDLGDGGPHVLERAYPGDHVDARGLVLPDVPVLPPWAAAA